MQARLSSSRTSLLLLASLIWISAASYAQDKWSMTDDYARGHVWEEVYQVPVYSGSPLYSSGDMSVEDGEVKFNDVGGRSDKRVYRKLGTPLDNTWKVEMAFTPTAGGSHGVGHNILSVTAGTASPNMVVPDVVGSQYPTFLASDQDGVFLQYNSPLYGGSSSYYVRLRAKDGATFTTAVSPNILLDLGSTYYIRLERTGSDYFTLSVFSDPERMTSIGTSVTLDLSQESVSLTGLNVIQHGNMQGSWGRKLTATLDDLYVYDLNLPCTECESATLILSNENRIKSTIYRLPVKNDTEINNLDLLSEKWIDVAYFDALGRPLEEVSVQGGPDCGGDVITYHQYDAFGRTATADLPYVASSGSAGSYRNNSGDVPITDQRSFYTNNLTHIPSSDRSKPFGITQFESSPLNRLIEQGFPGADWQPEPTSQGNQGSSEHTLIREYRTNQVAIYVFGTDAGQNDLPISRDAGTLMLTVTIDENGGITEVATDRLGNTLYQKVQIAGSTYAYTHYVYDSFGRVKYVIQPEGWEIAETSGLTSTVLDNYTFQYIYDGRGRVIEKKVPGAEKVYLIYDKLDRIVLTQDGAQREASPDQWSFTKYDKLNRPIITGIYSDNDDRATLQGMLDNEPILSESRSGSTSSINYGSYGYTNLAFPTLGAIESNSDVVVHSFTYYDNYDFDADHVDDKSYIADMEHFPDHMASQFVNGMVTGVRIRILDKDSNMPDWLWTVTFYDKYAREIQTQADNHLGGTDITWHEYNFAGELLFSKHEHKGYDTGTHDEYERSATIYTSNTYGPRGRLIRTEQKTEDPDNADTETDFVSLSENRYDEIGQLGQKNLFYESGDQFLQLGNYQYNIRGWLSKFNDPSTTAISGSYQDLLAFELHYNTGASAIVSGTENKFNGNISAMQWQVLGQGNEIRAYAFDYDNMNRLTEALYREKTSINWNVNTGRYDVKNLTYDKNGNIETLKRWGADTQTDPYSFGQMDDLTYTYKNSGNSNQLAKVSDAIGGTVHVDVDQFFDGNSSGDDYDYDDSGNLLEDLNKDITSITYNHLNKPTEVLFSSGKKIKYIYTAAGTKLRQKVFATGTSSTTTETDYIGSVHYEDSDGDGTGSGIELQLISHGEGRMRRSGTELIYETYLKDHLGNNRVMFSDLNDDGWVDPNVANGEVLQIDHYYPFGMRMAGISTTPAVPNSYLYNGKEYQDELGLGWHDYGARMYDASIGRWNGVDAMSEKYVSISPFAYVANNPMIFTDPAGDSIRLSDAFKQSIFWMSVYIEWLQTEDGTNFYNQFAEGRVNGDVLVIIDATTPPDAIEEGNQQSIAVSKDGSERIILPTEVFNKRKNKGADMSGFTTGLSKDEHLKIVLNMKSGFVLDMGDRLRGKLSILSGLETIIHESQHGKIDVQTLQKFGEILSTVAQHGMLGEKAGVWYQARREAILERGVSTLRTFYNLHIKREVGPSFDKFVERFVNPFPNANDKN